MDGQTATELREHLDEQGRRIESAGDALHLRGELFDSVTQQISAMQVEIDGLWEKIPCNVLIIMDPGQDLDDEMLLVLLKTLVNRGLVKCIGVVATLSPSVERARLARGSALMSLLALSQP